MLVYERVKITVSSQRIIPTSVVFFWMIPSRSAIGLPGIAGDVQIPTSQAITGAQQPQRSMDVILSMGIPGS